MYVGEDSNRSGYQIVTRNQCTSSISPCFDSRTVYHLSYALIKALIFTWTASDLAQKLWSSIKDSDLQSTMEAWGLHLLAHLIISKPNQNYDRDDVLLTIEGKLTVQKIHLNSIVQANINRGLREQKEHNIATP